MRWKRMTVALLVSTGLLTAGTGCSSADLLSSPAQTAESATWVKKQMQNKQKSIQEWQKNATRVKHSPADYAIAQLAINTLSKNIVSLLEQNKDNKPALLASVMKKEKQTETIQLPSLVSLQVTEKNQVDNGKTLYRLEGNVFTSVPDKLYPVQITVRVNKNGEIEYFEIDR
jgi:outer membrane PBP1 activator LpoA protein